ncbi:YheC/YheD family protein [Paenibacillus sp. MBLB4367]|uniref:YheC/YheD family endospore coat-associated protein n=1 Tax=Paenibacillus sp. MBLB4367 TaxID=3384767 RepID=UPI0039080892
MAATKIVIHVQNGSFLPDDRTVVLNAALVKRWKIPTGSEIGLHYGSQRKTVSVVTAAKITSMRLHEALASHLGIHQGARLCISYSPETKTLRVGPIVGVLVSRTTSDPEKPFGPISSFCRELTSACKAYGGLVYFFTPEDIPASAHSILGWVYTDKWTRKSFPIPDIVYNRLTTRKLENSPGVQQFMREAKSRFATIIFNEKYLNKTEVFQALQKDGALQSYLPESHLFKDYLTLKKMCGKYGTVFLKPVTGSLGKGIIRITKLPNSTYQCHYAGMAGIRKQSFPKLAPLYSSISGKMKTRSYQIQQGLKLLEVSERPVDFRALVQRGKTGDWEITSTVARIAGSETFVSNLARGGTLSPVQDAIMKTNLISTHKAAVPQRINKAALEIAKGIETQIDAHFAELGIDLAVDPYGKVWLLEVNSKPSKDDNSPLHAAAAPDKIRPSVRQIVRYSQHLAKFR